MDSRLCPCLPSTKSEIKLMRSATVQPVVMASQLIGNLLPDSNYPYTDLHLSEKMHNPPQQPRYIILPKIPVRSSIPDQKKSFCHSLTRITSKSFITHPILPLTLLYTSLHSLICSRLLLFGAPKATNLVKGCFQHAAPHLLLPCGLPFGLCLCPCSPAPECCN